MISRLRKLWNDYQTKKKARDEAGLLVFDDPKVTNPVGIKPEDIKCVECGSQDFFAGPVGGLCQNIQCQKCGTWHNIGAFNGTIFLFEKLEKPR